MYAVCSAVDSRKFAVVEFLSSDLHNGGGVSLVSSSWLLGDDQCYWPSSDDPRKQARCHARVGQDWTLWPCRVIGRSGMLNVNVCYWSAVLSVFAVCLSACPYHMSRRSLPGTGGYWRQRADERLVDSPPKVDPGAFNGQRQEWKTPGGPTGGTLLCACSGSALLGDLLGVSTSRERDLLSVLSTYPRFFLCVFIMCRRNLCLCFILL